MPSKRRPVKRSKGWEASLAHVVTIMRGPTLKTLAEARAYILKLPKENNPAIGIWPSAVFYRQPRRAALMTSRRPLARSSWPFCTRASCPCRPSDNCPDTCCPERSQKGRP
jgi:hypothetical protein